MFGSELLGYTVDSDLSDKHVQRQSIWMPLTTADMRIDPDTELDIGPYESETTTRRQLFSLAYSKIRRQMLEPSRYY